MRFLILVLTAGLATSACNRDGAADAAAGAKPVATADSGEAGSAAAGARPEPVTAWREVTIPAGTQLPIILDTSVGSSTSRVEEPVHAHLVKGIVVNGQTVLGEGSRISGVVTDATRSGRVKGRAHIAVRFDTLTPRGVDERYAIRTTPVGRAAPGTKKKDALEVGGAAAGGALVGALIGGKKGAAIGTAAGGGAGTAVVLSTRGKEVRLPKGVALTLRLSEPVTVRVRS